MTTYVDFLVHVADQMKETLRLRLLIAGRDVDQTRNL